MNILITGASRGIGAAAYALLKSSGHNVVGHSTRGSDDLSPAILPIPAAPRTLWDAALDRARRTDRRAGQQCRHLRGVADDAADDEWHAAWQRTLTVNLQAAADLSRLAVAHFLDLGGGRIVNVASRAAFRGDSPQHWHYAASKARADRHDQDHRPRLCRRRHPRLRGRAGLHGFGDDRGVSGRPRRRADRRRHPARAASSTTDEVAEVIRWLAIDAPASATGTSIDVNGASYVR